MSEGSVLIIDDDAAFRFAVGKALRRHGYLVLEAEGGEAALALLASEPAPDVALLDLRMKDMDGLEVLRRRGSSRTRVIVLTGHGTVQATVEAMKLGAFSFLEKPVDMEILQPQLRQALADGKKPVTVGNGDFAPPLVGTSPAIEMVRKFIATVGPTNETVTVFGETGTGKEVVARHVHLASPRRDGPFVAMNAACVPRDLFESELFGHKRGSFTGATSDRQGLFREAHGGTLFIDELGELPIDSQAKLLRALETRMVRPVGESREFQADVRFVAATNRDLWTEVQEGRFREDLYFRLQVFPIVLPPLRERLEDLPSLAEHLLSRLGPSAPSLSREALAALAEYEWPGNVRELLNVLRRASLFAEGGPISAELVRRMVAASVFGQVRTPVATGRGSSPGFLPAPTSSAVVPPRLLPSAGSLADVERAHIEQVLAAMEGNVTRAATALGIDRRTLQRKMKSYGLGGEG